jgi:hypothetical protein
VDATVKTASAKCGDQHEVSWWSGTPIDTRCEQRSARSVMTERYAKRHVAQRRPAWGVAAERYADRHMHIARGGGWQWAHRTWRMASSMGTSRNGWQTAEQQSSVEIEGVWKGGEREKERVRVSEFLV